MLHQKAEYICADSLSPNLSTCGRAADHTFSSKWIISGWPTTGTNLGAMSEESFSAELCQDDVTG